MKRCSVPMKGLSPPNIRPQPSSRKPRDETAKTMKFLERMLTVFLDRAKPASTLAKPRFMKKTSIAARNTHKVSIKENSTCHASSFSVQGKKKKRTAAFPGNAVVLLMGISYHEFFRCQERRPNFLHFYEQGPSSSSTRKANTGSSATAVPVWGSNSMRITSRIYSFQRATTGLSACTLAA